MSPLIGGDIPMDETENEGVSTVPNGVINVEMDGSDEDWSDEDEGDEEEDGELPEYAGYQLLSQENETENADITDPSTQPAAVNLPSHLAGLLPSQVPQPDPSASVSYRDNKEEQENRKKAMAEDEQIKTAMVGFTLPASSVPMWASSIAEDDWKRTLLMKMNDHCKQTDSHNTDQNTDR